MEKHSKDWTSMVVSAEEHQLTSPARWTSAGVRSIVINAGSSVVARIAAALIKIELTLIT